MFDGFRTIYPLLLKYELGFSEVELASSWAFIYGIGLLIGFLTRIPIGLFTDRFSKSISLSLAGVLCLIAIIGTLFTDSIFLFAIYLGLIRTGAHVFPMIARAFVFESSKSHYGRFNGSLMLIANFGQMFGPIILSYFFEISLSSMVLIASFFTLISVLTLIKYLPINMDSNSASIKVILENLLKEMSTMKILILFFLLAGIFNGIASYTLVPYLSFVFELPVFSTGMIVGLIQFANIFLILVGGEVIDKLGVNISVGIGITAEGIGGLIIFLIPDSLYVFIACQFLLVGGVAFIMTSATTKISFNASKKSFASTFGALTSFSFLGTALSPSITSKLYISNSSFPFLLITIVAIISLWTVIDRKTYAKIRSMIK